MSEEKNDQAVADKMSEPNIAPDIAASIDENDPHKVEKLANIGKDTDAAEESE